MNSFKSDPFGSDAQFFELLFIVCVDCIVCHHYTPFILIFQPFNKFLYTLKNMLKIRQLIGIIKVISTFKERVI